jgi:hypothetical protein
MFQRFRPRQLIPIAAGLFSAMLLIVAVPVAADGHGHRHGGPDQRAANESGEGDRAHRHAPGGGEREARQHLSNRPEGDASQPSLQKTGKEHHEVGPHQRTGTDPNPQSGGDHTRAPHDAGKHPGGEPVYAGGGRQSHQEPAQSEADHVRTPRQAGKRADHAVGRRHVQRQTAAAVEGPRGRAQLNIPLPSTPTVEANVSEALGGLATQVPTTPTSEVPLPQVPVPVPQAPALVPASIPTPALPTAESAQHELAQPAEVALRMRVKQLQPCLDYLPGWLRHVLELRTGIGTPAPLVPAATAQLLNVSTRRVVRLEHRAITRLGQLASSDSCGHGSEAPVELASLASSTPVPGVDGSTSGQPSHASGQPVLATWQTGSTTGQPQSASAQLEPAAHAASASRAKPPRKAAGGRSRATLLDMALPTKHSETFLWGLIVLIWALLVTVLFGNRLQVTRPYGGWRARLMHRPYRR